MSNFVILRSGDMFAHTTIIPTELHKIKVCLPGCIIAAQTQPCCIDLSVFLPYPQYSQYSTRYSFCLNLAIVYIITLFTADIWQVLLITSTVALFHSTFPVRVHAWYQETKIKAAQWNSAVYSLIIYILCLFLMSENALVCPVLYWLTLRSWGY